MLFCRSDLLKDEERMGGGGIDFLIFYMNKNTNTTISPRMFGIAVALLAPLIVSSVYIDITLISMCYFIFISNSSRFCTAEGPNQCDHLHQTFTTDLIELHY